MTTDVVLDVASFHISTGSWLASSCVLVFTTLCWWLDILHDDDHHATTLTSWVHWNPRRLPMICLLASFQACLKFHNSSHPVKRESAFIFSSLIRHACWWLLSQPLISWCNKTWVIHDVIHDECVLMSQSAGILCLTWTSSSYLFCLGVLVVVVSMVRMYAYICCNSSETCLFPSWAGLELLSRLRSSPPSSTSWNIEYCHELSMFLFGGNAPLISVVK